MRRFVATLLVVASPAVLAVPVGARPAGLPGWAGSPATPAVAPAAPAPAVLLAPVAVTIAPVAPRLAPAVTTPAVRRATVGRVRPRGVVPAAVSDAAYRARLQAELCRARTIFCGLDSSGHYPAG